MIGSIGASHFAKNYAASKLQNNNLSTSFFELVKNNLNVPADNNIKHTIHSPSLNDKINFFSEWKEFMSYRNPSASSDKASAESLIKSAEKMQKLREQRMVTGQKNSRTSNIDQSLIRAAKNKASRYIFETMFSKIQA